MAAEVDRSLAALAARIELLLDVTPVDADEAWDLSVAAGHDAELTLRYRDLGTDVAAVRRALAAVPVADVEDERVGGLLAASAAEMDLQLLLIGSRGTPAFLDRSLDLWGTADDAHVALATRLLARLPPSPGPAPLVSPERFAERARAEVEHLRRQDPGLRASVAVRPDVPSLMVVQRDVLVGTDSVVPRGRQEALVQHEVGTHLLTAVTGGRQPLGLLEHGLAGADETQEALGVLAEHLVSGIDADRMRTLAARALAVRRLTDGAGFPDLFRELHRDHGFDERAAWAIAMRVVRGGGLTKDVIYLRGLVDLVAHLAAGGDLTPLLVGKLHLRDVAVVEDLLADGVLTPPHLRPRWLEGAAPTARLDALRAGAAPVDDWPWSDPDG